MDLSNWSFTRSRKKTLSYTFYSFSWIHSIDSTHIQLKRIKTGYQLITTTLLGLTLTRTGDSNLFTPILPRRFARKSKNTLFEYRDTAIEVKISRKKAKSAEFSQKSWKMGWFWNILPIFCGERHIWSKAAEALVQLNFRPKKLGLVRENTRVHRPS